MKGATWTAWACSLGIVMASYGGPAAAAPAKSPAPSPAPAAAKAPSPPPAPAPKPPAPPAPVAKSAAAPAAAVARQAAALPPMAPAPKPTSPAVVASPGAGKLVPAQAASPSPSAGQQGQPPRAPLSNPPVLPGASPSAKAPPTIAMTPPPRPSSPGPAPMSTGRLAGVTAAATATSKLNFTGLPTNAQRQLAAPAQQFANRAASVQIVREPTTSGWTWLFLAWALSESSKSHRLAEERSAMQARMDDLERDLRRDPAQWTSLQDTRQRLQQTMPPAEWDDDGEPAQATAPASARASAAATVPPVAFSDRMREQLGDPLSDGPFNKVLIGLVLAMGLSVGLLGLKYTLE